MSHAQVDDIMRIEVLRQCYDATTATEIARYYQQFRPDRDNFEPLQAFFAAHPPFPAVRLLHLSWRFVITVGRAREPLTVIAGFVFPPQFPTKPLVVHIVSQIPLRADNMVVASSRVVRLAELPLLRDAPQPYPLSSILVALADSFESNCPFDLSSLHPAAPAALSPPPPSGAVAMGSPVAAGTPYGHVVMGAVVAPSAPPPPAPAPAPTPQPPAPPQPPAVRQDSSPLAALFGGAETSGAAEARLAGAVAALQEHLVRRAAEYLDQRAAGQRHIAALADSARALDAAEAALRERSAKCEAALAATSGVLAALRDAQRHERDLLGDGGGGNSSLEALLRPADESNAAALQLVAEIHAGDDVLDLLERALRQGQLTCDEYVRAVSDAARTQFASRLAYQRLCAAHMPHAERAARLRAEFPHLGADVIDSVLASVGGDAAEAAVQLRAMM